MRTFALAIAATLLLTSCTDDPEPIEPKPSISAKPSPSAPGLPKDATTDTPDAAIAFAAHWIDTFNFAVNSGQLDAFAALNEPGCKGCQSYEEEIVRLNNGSAEVRGFAWTGGKTSLNGKREVEVAIRSKEYEVRDSATDKWSRVRAAKYQLGLELRWSDGQWAVRELYIPKEAK